MSYPDYREIPRCETCDDTGSIDGETFSWCPDSWCPDCVGCAVCAEPLRWMPDQIGHIGYVSLGGHLSDWICSTFCLQAHMGNDAWTDPGRAAEILSVLRHYPAYYDRIHSKRTVHELVEMLSEVLS